MAESERKVHPAAAVFPMLPDDELAELAEDIKANGLLHPITLGPDGSIWDGRNRGAACKLAGVEPRYETMNGQDPVAFILSANVHRRHMSEGQSAIAVARVRLLETNNRTQAQTARLTGVKRARIACAEVILAFAADLVAGIMAGTESFDKAYEVAQARKRGQETELAEKDRQARQDAIELERLRRAAPDLAALVPDTLTVAEAKETLVQREQRARGEREAKARVAEMMAAWLDPGLKTTSDELAAQIVSTLDARALSTRPDFSAARFARCTATLGEIVRLLEERNGSSS